MGLRLFPYAAWTSASLVPGATDGPITFQAVFARLRSSVAMGLVFKTHGRIQRFPHWDLGLGVGLWIYRVHMDMCSDRAHHIQAAFAAFGIVRGDGVRLHDTWTHVTLPHSDIGLG